MGVIFQPDATPTNVHVNLDAPPEVWRPTDREHRMARPIEMTVIALLCDDAGVPRLGADGVSIMTLADRVRVLAAWAKARRS